MSGSRAIVLKLSVQDADIVRQQLVAMGEQGARALAALDGAAQKTAGGSGSGLQQLTQATEKAQGGGVKLGQAFGSAGYQVQDFATQVSMGQNALVAFSTQASQFLGIFGTGGAIAGAILTVGILAYQILGLADATDEAAAAQERLEGALRKSAEFFETAAESAARAAREQRAQLALTFSAESRRLQDEIEKSQKAIQTLEADRARIIDANRNLPGFNPDAVLRDPLAAERERLRTLELQRGEIEARRTGALGDPSGAERERAESLRRTLDDEYRIRAEYQERIDELRALRTRGLFDDAELGRREIQAQQARDEALHRLGAEARREADRQARELEQQQKRQADIVDRAAASARRDRERYLDIAGAATPEDRARRDFDRQRQELSDFFSRGIISYREYTDAVEANGAALGRQIEDIQRRGSGVSDVARELGFTFTSAFEDAIVRGKELRDVLSGIAQDIARLIIRKSITEPLNAAASTALAPLGTGIARALGFGSAPGGAAGGITPLPSTGGISANPYGFAMGGIMTSAGPLPLHRYERGGIADSPQLALFAEGRLPEAYVPLPDGRRIPVKMDGAAAGDVYAPQITVHAPGADPAAEARIYANVRRIVAEMVPEMSRRGGGASARIRGA